MNLFLKNLDTTVVRIGQIVGPHADYSQLCLQLDYEPARIHSVHINVLSASTVFRPPICIETFQGLEVIAGWSIVSTLMKHAPRSTEITAKVWSGMRCWRQRDITRSDVFMDQMASSNQGSRRKADQVETAKLLEDLGTKEKKSIWLPSPFSHG